MRTLRRTVAVATALVLSAAALTALAVPSNAGDITRPPRGGDPCSFDGDLTSFYTAPAGSIRGDAGTLVRCQERTDIQGLTGARAYRIMYVTEAPAPGSYGARAKRPRAVTLVKRYSTGMLFIPTARPPLVGGRKIVAWDHGTVGMGQTCAPSISGYSKISAVTSTSKPNMSFGFVQNMINKNWVVAATDYAGLGIIDQSASLQYLIGASEAYDTVNAVRVAVDFPGSGATYLQRKPAYAVYGQSQGGHAALWTGVLAPSYAPELKLMSVAASDPAANMVPLVAQQYNKLIAWVLGPEVAIAWPAVQPNLRAADVLTASGTSNYRTIANKCVTAAAIAGLVTDPLGKKPFFTADVISDPAWLAMQRAQTPPVILDLPVLIGQAQNDGVVLANTTASLQQAWCTAGADLSMYWVKPSGVRPFSFIPSAMAHLNSASVDALAAIAFISNEFAGKSTPISGVTPCTTAPPTPLS